MTENFMSLIARDIIASDTRRRIRPMRGQAVIREVIPAASEVLWTPDPSNPRDVKTHRGVVLALGDPPRTVTGHEVPWGFAVGDTVVYHWEHNEKGATHEWTDGKPACWLLMREIDGVIE